MYPTAAGVRNIASTSMRYVPEIWSGKLLVKFYDRTVLNAIANTDYEGEIRKQGDTVWIRTLPDIIIRNHKKGQALKFDQPESEPVSLLIDKGKSWSFTTNKIDDVQTDIKDYTDRWTEVASKNLKIAIDTDVLGNVYADAHASNQGNTAGLDSADLTLGAATAPKAVTSANVLEYFTMFNQALDEQNAPEEGRWAVIPPWLSRLIKHSDLKDASLSGDGTSMLRNGRIGMIDGLELFKSNLLARTADTLNGNAITATNVIFGTKDAITFASQLVENDSDKNPFGFGRLFKGLQVYGYEVVKPEALGRFYCVKG